MLAVCEVACELPEEATVGQNMQVAKALIVFVSMSSFDKCSRCVVQVTVSQLRGSDVSCSRRLFKGFLNSSVCAGCSAS